MLLFSTNIKKLLLLSCLPLKYPYYFTLSCFIYYLYILFQEDEKTKRKIKKKSLSLTCHLLFARHGSTLEEKMPGNIPKHSGQGFFLAFQIIVYIYHSSSLLSLSLCTLSQDFHYFSETFFTDENGANLHHDRARWCPKRPSNVLFFFIPSFIFPV